MRLLLLLCISSFLGLSSNAQNQYELKTNLFDLVVQRYSIQVERWNMEQGWGLEAGITYMNSSVWAITYDNAPSGSTSFYDQDFIEAHIDLKKYFKTKRENSWFYSGGFLAYRNQVYLDPAFLDLLAHRPNAVTSRTTAQLVPMGTFLGGKLKLNRLVAELNMKFYLADLNRLGSGNYFMFDFIPEIKAGWQLY